MHDTDMGTRAVKFVLFINNCVQSMGGQIDLESVYSTNLRTLPIAIVLPGKEGAHQACQTVACLLTE